MKSSRIKLIIVALLILNVAMSYFTFLRPTYVSNRNVSAQIPNDVLMSPIPTPTIMQVVQTSEMLSPEGAKKLILKQTTEGDTVSYDCSVLDTASGDSTTVFQKVTTTAEVYRIPYNSWSPENAYFFLTVESAGKINSHVFRATGEMFKGELPMLDVSEIFEAKIEGFNITEVTGWASPTLVVINTISTDNANKVSFWLDVPSQSIIRLSTYFE